MTQQEKEPQSLEEGLPSSTFNTLSRLTRLIKMEKNYSVSFLRISM